MSRYCKAYKLEDLRKYANWSASAKENEKELEDDAIVYIVDNNKVTQNPLDLDNEEDYIFDALTPEWEKFIADELDFAVPTDEELSPPVAES